jgi:uncharacterized protein (TIGR02679 family)
MTSRIEKLQTIFSAKGWTRFIDCLRGYRDRGKPFPAAVTLSEVNDEERRHHARLLRLPNPSQASSLRYDLAKINGALEAMNIAASWEEIVSLICGLVPQHKLTDLATKQSWEAFWPQAGESLSVEPFPYCHEWFDSLRRDGTLRRLSKSDAALAQRWFKEARVLLRSLPLLEELPLASVAAKYCGNSHAIDPNTALSSMVLRGLALRQKQPSPSRSDDRRELWAAFGVVCDELSAPVLTFNLGLNGNGLLCKLIEQADEGIQPLHLTTRLLWSTDWDQIRSPSEVYVCENPTIVSLAANRFGKKCPPLICVNGEPKTASRILLRHLCKQGTRLNYHGDFDWPGIAIASRVFQELGASPWCYDEKAYLQAARYQGRTLIGTPVATPWSPNLSLAMQSVGIAYDEELLADELLHNLG